MPALTVMASSLLPANRRGQGIVEYLLMISVVVGVIMVIGAMFKPQISGIFQQIMDKIQSAIRQVG